MKTTFDQEIKDTLLTSYDVSTNDQRNLELDDGSKFDSLTVTVQTEGKIVSMSGSELVRIQAVIANIHPAFRINMITAHYFKGKNEIQISFTRDHN